MTSQQAATQAPQQGIEARQVRQTRVFRSIFTRSLYGYRWAILGWGIGLGIVIYAQYATFSSVLGSASAGQIQQLVQQFRFFGEAIRVDTPGGYVTFKIMGLLPALLGIWTVLAGARMIRGEEESGALDVLLSTPQSRRAVLSQKLLALAAATGLISLIIALWITLGMRSARASVDPWHALLASLNVGVTAFLFGSLAALLAQFMGRSVAAGWTGSLMAAWYVLDGTGRAIHGMGALQRISPFYYYDLNLPLVPGYAIRWDGFIVLTILCLALCAAEFPIFFRRDIGRTALADVSLVSRRETSAGSVARAAHDPWLRGVGWQAFRRQGTAMVWWIVSLAVFAGYLIIVAKSSEQALERVLGNSALIKDLFNVTNLGTNAGFMAALVFSYMPLLVAIFGGLMAGRWATDLDHGRLELVLATPQPRSHLILMRYCVVFLGVAVVTCCLWVSIVIFAAGDAFSIDAGAVAEACIGIIPPALITASLVFLLAELLPPGAVMGAMALFLAVSFLADILKTLLHLPAWVVRLSIFYQYGTPLLSGLNWVAFVAMLAIAATVLAGAVWLFVTRDLVRGTVTP